MNERIKNKLALLPDQPGCYLMKDKNGTIIYVGKAKILKNRVRSYFTGSHNTKTERLVSEIEDFEYIVTESNIEALLLEINLIKKNDPKYNIMLKDDKTYPFLKITNEKYPRLVITRKVLKDKALYFGPYPDVGAANETKKILDRLFPLRKCKPSQTKEPCLYYHLGQCLCPYYFDVDPKVYTKIVDEVKNFLNGGHEKIESEIHQKMEKAAENMEFEKAAEYRDQIRAIETIMTRQKMTNTDLLDRDVFGYAIDKGWMCVQVFFVRQGKLIERDVSMFPFYNEAEEDFLTYIGQFYQENEHFIPKEVLIPDTIDKPSVEALLATKVLQPKRGEKKKLVELANKNASVALNERFDLIARKQRTIGAVERLGNAMNIPTPIRIESFDNSNIMGTNPVAAMVVFIDGKPARKEYRKYKIKTVNGPDDYASMREVIYRRYSRVIREGLPLPDLILIDGGKGQVDVAKDVLENQLGIDIPIAGMAKNDKHKTNELLFGTDLAVVPLERNSPEFFLLQRIQDEVHRFAITFHRQLRSKNSFASRLDEIEGLGPKRKKMLLKEFKSLKNITAATTEELQEIGLPKNVAQNVFDKLHQE